MQRVIKGEKPIALYITQKTAASEGCGFLRKDGIMKN